MSSMGSRIKDLREDRGLSIAELARRIGIKQPSLWLIEAGKTKSLRAKTLAALCDELQTTPAYLLNDQRRDGDVDLPAMEAELIYTIRTLPADKRLALLEYARFLMRQPGTPPPAPQAETAVVRHIKPKRAKKPARKPHAAK